MNTSSLNKYIPYNSGHRYYCPYRYKYQLVNWASQRFNRSKTHFNEMSKSKLYAIYYNC